MYEDRVAQAVENYKNGYNCSQAVVAAFADLYGMDKRMALRMAASFGGGIGRMRLTCGAACGMFMLVGLETGSDDLSDKAAKMHNYEVVQQLARRFKEENGSLNCGELLGLVPTDHPMPKKRSCSMMVESAARLFADYLVAQQGK